MGKMMMNNEENYLDVDDYFEFDHTGTQHLEIDYSEMTYDIDYEYEYVPYYEYD